MFKSWVGIILLVLGLGSFSVNATEDGMIPDSIRDEFYAVDTLVAAFQTLKQHEAEIWPGYKPTERPLLIAFQSGHLYVVFDDTVREGWQHNAGFQSRSKIYYRLTDNLGVTEGWLAPTVKIGEKVLGFSLIPQEYLDARDFSGLVQSVIAQQFLNYLDDEKITAPAPFRLEPRVRASRLAMMALGQEEMRRYLESKDSGHLLNYAAMLAERKRVTNAAEFDRETLLAIRKGLPDYVSMKVLAKFFPALNFKTLVAKTLAETTAETDIIAWAYTERYTGLGAALAIALDDLKVRDWKGRVGKETLQAMVLEALGASDDQVRDRVAALVNDDDYRKRVSDTEDMIANYEQQLSILERDFLNEPGFHVFLDATSFPLSFQGVNKQSYILLDTGNLIQFGVNGLLFDKEHLIQALFKGSDFLSTPAGNWHFVANEGFKLIVDDGAPILVSSGAWARRFNHLTWSASTSVVKITTPGRIEAKDHSLHITLDALEK